MNLQQAQDPDISAALGASLGTTGDTQAQALTQLNTLLTERGWYVPVYEDFTYAGYNADSVQAPAFAGTNNYLVLSAIQRPDACATRDRRWPGCCSPATGTHPSRLEPPMLAFVARRLAFAVVTVLVAVLISFLLVHASDTTPGAVRLGAGATAADIAAENARLGWDDPLWQQFGRYLGQLVHLDLGTSLIDGRDIESDLAARLPVTASVAVLATLLSGVVGVLLGVTAAVRGGRLGKVISTGSGIALSLPQFWIGVLLVYVLSLQAGCCRPPATCPSRRTRPLAGQHHAAGARADRRRRRDRGPHLGRLDAGGARGRAHPHLRATGTPEWRIRYVHALRSAAVPVVAVLGIQFIALFGGSVIIENLFALPGLGQASQAAASSGDFPALVGVVVVATVVVVLVNLLLDLVTAALDPKVRAA